MIRLAFLVDSPSKRAHANVVSRLALGLTETGQAETTIVCYSDDPPPPFSFMTERIDTPQVVCHITTTTSATHELIRANLARSPMYSGQIASIGPRRLIRIVSSQTAVDSDSIGPSSVEAKAVAAALLNRMSIRPKAAAAAAFIPRTRLRYTACFKFFRSSREYRRYPLAVRVGSIRPAFSQERSRLAEMRSRRAASPIFK